METQEIYERKLFSKAPLRRGKNHACVLSPHSFQRGLALISMQICAADHPIRKWVEQNIVACSYEI